MAIEEGAVYRILGDETLRELRPERMWTQADGVGTLHRYVGPADVIEEYFNQLSAEGVDSGADEFGERYTGKKGELLLRINDDSGEPPGLGGNTTEALNAIWELYAYELRKPIESHIDFDGITAPRKRLIEKKARAAETFTGSTIEEKLYAYYGNNVLNYISTDLILRKTTTVSIRTTIEATYADLNKVVTIAAINPPTAILGALTSLPKLGTTDGAWEWLKLGPQVQQVTKTKYQLSYRWHGASRWADIYGGTWVPAYS